MVIGAMGLLVSPNRGLLFFAPVALLGFWGAGRAVRERSWFFVALGLGALLAVLLFGAFGLWWGGHAFGPRFLTETMPVLVVLLVPLVRTSEGQRRAVIVGLIVASTAVGAASQTIGAVTHPCGWDTTPRSVDEDPSRVWSLRDSQILRCASQGPTFNPSGLLRPTHRLEGG